MTAVLPALLVLMAPSSGNAAYQQVFMIGMMIVIFWFFLFMPQQKQRKEHEQRVTGLKRGDEVVTTGGVVGEVVYIKESTKDGAPVKSMDDRITIKTGETRLVVERRAIAKVIVPGAPADTKA